MIYYLWNNWKETLRNCNSDHFWSKQDHRSSAKIIISSEKYFNHINLILDFPLLYSFILQISGWKNLVSIGRNGFFLDLRTNVLYYQLYYTYMYTIFMAVGPLLIIVILNVFVVTAVFKKGASGNFYYCSLYSTICRKTII